MSSITRITSRLARAFAAVCFISTLATAGTITVTPTITSVGGLFHYDYTITNSTPDDVLLIDIPVPQSGKAIKNLVAPSGYLSVFDSGLGLVSFLEDSALFGSIPVSGFAFDSVYAPGLTTFRATVLTATAGDIDTVSGSTMAPVPEPGYGSLIAVSMLAILLSRRLCRNNV